MTASTDAARDGDPCTAPDGVDCNDRDVFPCWPCYRAGRADVSTDAEPDTDDVDHEGNGDE